jgi:hypothetical protein
MRLPSLCLAMGVQVTVCTKYGQNIYHKPLGKHSDITKFSDVGREMSVKKGSTTFLEIRCNQQKE